MWELAPLFLNLIKSNHHIVPDSTDALNFPSLSPRGLKTAGPTSSHAHFFKQAFASIFAPSENVVRTLHQNTLLAADQFNPPFLARRTLGYVRESTCLTIALDHTFQSAKGMGADTVAMLNVVDTISGAVMRSLPVKSRAMTDEVVLQLQFIKTDFPNVDYLFVDDVTSDQGKYVDALKRATGAKHVVLVHSISFPCMIFGTVFPLSDSPCAFSVADDF